MSDGLASFSVGKLDFGSFTDEAATQQQATKASPISKPGTYQVKVKSFKLTQRMTKDGAGKLWGSLYLNVESDEGRFMRDFIDVPLEALEHTSKSGKKTQTKSKKFLALISSLVGRKIKLGELEAMIKDLPNLLTNATITAVVDHRVGPRVAYLQDNIQGDKKYGVIIRAAGKEVIETLYRNMDGSIAAYSTREEALNAYKAATNITPSQGVGFVTFRINERAEAVA